MKEFVTRLSSRKFLLTVGIVVTACANRQYAAAAAAGIGYLASEGVIDYRAVGQASQVEARAHQLATELLDELSQQPARPQPQATEPDRPSPERKPRRQGR